MRLEPLEQRTLLHADPVSSMVGDLSHDDHDHDDASPAALVGPDVVPAAVSAQALLPDMIPWTSQSRGFLYDWTVQGDELRLTSAAANIGTGRMELRGGATHGNTQDVYQRIYEPNGSFTDVLAGTFTYHSEHGHIHFDGFAEYRLRSILPDGSVGPIVAAGDKISFCLLDVERYNTSGPSSPYFMTCGQVQGISAGWADVYDRGLPGQEIDITGVPNGNYFLEAVVDPDNRLMESNEDNNVARIQIALQRSGGGGTIPQDAFEPNNSFSAASILAPPEDHAYTDLSIHAANNSDYYRVTASATGALTFSLSFLNSQGDIDMEVFNANQTLLGRSDSVSNSEQFSVNATAGVYYFVRAFGYNGATNPNYTFSVDQPEGTGTGVGDLFEQNDSFAQAYALTAVDQIYTGLSIDAANDDDYYSVVPTVSGTMVVSLAFQNSQGNINLQVFNSAQTQLGQSTTTGNSEQVSVAVTAGQTYYVRVFGLSGAINPSYSMTINVPEAAAGDPFEDNDSFGAARSLTAVDQTYTGLSINAPNDDDYYSVVPLASGTMVVSLAFQNSQGDIDLQVFNASQSQIAQSDSVGNSEQVSVQVTAGQTYFIRAFGYNGAVNPTYSLTLNVPEPLAPDQFEENDSFAAARSLNAVDQTFAGLSINAANDDDYYSLVPTVSGTMVVSLAFQNSQGNINLQVFNSAQTQLGQSTTTGNSEQVSVAVTAGQTYYVRVFGVSGATNPSYSLTLNVPETGGGTLGVYYLSTTAGGTVSGVSFADADILQLTVQANGQYQYQLYIDGSDVGLTTSNEDIDAFTLLPDGSMIVSTVGSFSVPAAGGGTLSGSGQDLLRFVPTSLGPTTAGQWSFYFDGSDVGLTTSGENIDAVAVLSDGRLLISTTGGFSVSGASGLDEDLLAFTPTSLGTTTAGSWSLYFDGSDVGLSTNNNEDVNALYVRETGGNPTLFFATIGSFSVTGVSGANEDAFAFNPTSLGSNTAGTFGPGLAFDGSLYGLASFGLDGIFLGDPNVNPTAVPGATASNAVATAVSLAATAPASDDGPSASSLAASTSTGPSAAPNSQVASPTTSTSAPPSTNAGQLDSATSRSLRDQIAEMLDDFLNPRHGF